MNFNNMKVVEIPLEQQKEISGGFMWGLFFLVALGTRMLLDMID